MRNNTHIAYDLGRGSVRLLRHDIGALTTHYADMTERPRWYLKEWRKHAGYSLERLAEVIGTSKGHLGDIERGTRRYNEDILEQLALALNTTPADILRRRPQDPAGIEVKGLEPEQVRILNAMAEQMRKTG